MLSQDDVHKSADEWPKERDPPQIGRSRGRRSEDREREIRVVHVEEGEARERAGRESNWRLRRAGRRQSRGRRVEGRKWTKGEKINPTYSDNDK